VRAEQLLEPPRLPQAAPAPAVIPDEPQLNFAPGVGSTEGVPEQGDVPVGIPGGVHGGLTDSPTIPPPSLAQNPVRIGPKAQGAAPIFKVLPVYPEVAERQRLQGVVILDVVVDREGTPMNLRVIRSHAVFDAAALEAVKKWRWSPYLVNGQPVPFKVLVTVQFQLTTKR